MGEKEKWREEGKDGRGEREGAFLKKLRVAQGYYALSIGIFKKPQKYIFLERNWAQIHCNHSIFHAKMSGAFLPLEELFNSLKPVLSNSPEWWMMESYMLGFRLICNWKECYSSWPNVFQINTTLIDVIHHKTEGFLNWEYMIETEHMVRYRKSSSSRMCEWNSIFKAISKILYFGDVSNRLT